MDFHKISFIVNHITNNYKNLKLYFRSQVQNIEAVTFRLLSKILVLLPTRHILHRYINEFMCICFLSFPVVCTKI